MKLYILRHGLALTLSEAKVSSDAERPLAELGHEESGKDTLILLRTLKRGW